MKTSEVSVIIILFSSSFRRLYQQVHLIFRVPTRNKVNSRNNFKAFWDKSIYARKIYC
jgi:hypothetical protein